MKSNKLIIGTTLFFVIPLILYGVFMYGVRYGRDQMFYELKKHLKKAGVELIDGGKIKNK